MAGWDAWLGNLQVKADKYIVGLDGTAWTVGGGPAVEADNLQKIAKGFADNGSLYASGPKINDTKYMCVEATDKVIRGKKGAKGFIACKSIQCFSLVVFDEDNCTPQAAMVASTAFVELLAKSGF